MLAILLFSTIGAYKIGVPSPFEHQLAPIINAIDHRIQVVPYDIQPLFRIGDEICVAAKHGIIGIILPPAIGGRRAAAAIARSRAASAAIPHVGLDDVGVEAEARARAAAEFIKTEKWTEIVAIFEHPDELLGVTDLITLGHFHPNAFTTQLVRLKHADEFGVELKHIKNRLDRYRIVLNIPWRKSLRFLQQAANLSMCGVLYHYVILDADLVTHDLNTVAGIDDCNVTSFAMFDVRAKEAREARARLALPITVAIWYDTIGLLLRSLNSIEFRATPKCGEIWRHGEIAMELMYTNATFRGITGEFYFNAERQRRNYTLHVYKRTNHELEKYAEWNEHTNRIVSSTRRPPSSSSSPTSSNVSEKLSLEGRHLKVTVYLEAPFVMIRRDDAAYEGYCIDLLAKIAALLKFNYTIRTVHDDAYGTRGPNGKWSGMVGELQRGEADLAVASLTISYGRSEVIDFTVPYMHLGISILFKKPRPDDSDYFRFLDPLSAQVWMMTFASYVMISVAIWLIANPYEQFEMDADGTYRNTGNQFALRNAFWFAVCSLMQQGSELCPRAASTRLITAVWWFFALILISSYTANLAAVLTARRMVTPIENADDLVAQTKIKYGSLGGGSTMSFFKESKIETYERMWQVMSSQPGLLVQSSAEGIKKVKTSDYAYLMESSMLEYAVERDCELMQIGGLIDQKGYGIGLPKGSPYRELISTAILRLQEKTELTELKEKWWKDKSVVCEQSRRKDQDDGESIGGIFVILVVGLVLTMILVIWELIATRRNAAAAAARSASIITIPTIRLDFFNEIRIMGDGKSQILNIQPSRELVFQGPFTDIVTSYITLTNPSPKPVCFKVKTTVPKKYCVRPNFGLIHAGDKKVITVMLQPMDEPPSDAVRHKFMVQSCFAPSDGVVDIDSVWKVVESSDLMYSKLKVVFVNKEGKTEETKNADGDSYATVAQVSDLDAGNTSQQDSETIASLRRTLQKTIDEKESLRTQVECLHHQINELFQTIRMLQRKKEANLAVAVGGTLGEIRAMMLINFNCGPCCPEHH
ncbi:unnamed protein product [Caenorhabditis bovis]|uniref:MSP domain-containing protein n=1 Tax=Caenorhabditis bovis TaxID=2654633 RepID=A0A8S1F710_9PELO|nr:unnamed protein product [Caenorhabditis bovis]